MEYIKSLHQVGIHDSPLVGGKTASLGQMIQYLTQKGVKIPDGFAITARAYRHYLDYNSLAPLIKKIVNSIDLNDLSSLTKKAKEVRELICKAEMPSDLFDEIAQSYQELSKEYHTDEVDVAVRSSATAEDLPGASFAGQQESFLHIQGQKQLIEACKKCFASLFTDRAIMYRSTKGFDHLDIALSIVVQKMVRSDLAVSGVAFSLDTETGFKDLIMIDASYGLGEAVVQGIVNPDEYRVFKTTLKEGFNPIIKKVIGSKRKKLIYATEQKKVEWVPVEQSDAQRFCLTDSEIQELSKNIVLIEDYYTQLNGFWSPMDIEWAKDGLDGSLYIVQARPETVHSLKKQSAFMQLYSLQEAHKKDAAQQILVEGQSVGTKIVSGKARIIKSAKDAAIFNEGDILVTQMTDPDWVPLMQKAAGIVTEEGGRTCHAAIVSQRIGYSCCCRRSQFAYLNKRWAHNYLRL